MTGHRLGPYVRAADGAGLWVAAVPDGPILRVDGAGAMVLAVLEGRDPLSAANALADGVDEADPVPAVSERPVLTAAQIVEALAAHIPDLPEDAAPAVRDFLAQLHDAGVVETVGAAEGGELVLSLPGTGLALTFGPGHEALAAEAAELWEHLADPAAEVTLRRTVLPRRDPSCPEAMVIAPGPSAAYALSGQITRAVIQALIGTRVLLHAGVIDHRALGPVLLVGPSGAGKSTAVSVLGRQGGYLSDELAILDPGSFALTAFPKPVSRIGADGLKRDAAPSALGLRPVAQAGAPVRIVLLDRLGTGADEGAGEGAARARGVRRIPLEHALPLLIAQSSSLSRVPGGLAALADLVTSAGGALQVRYRESEELPALLSAAPAALEEDWEELPAAAPASAHPRTAGALTVAPYDQALVLGSGVLVLEGSRAGSLPGLAGLVWERLRDAGGLDPDQLESVVAAELGAHPHSRTLLASTVDELVRGGWVVRR